MQESALKPLTPTESLDNELHRVFNAALSLKEKQNELFLEQKKHNSAWNEMTDSCVAHGLVTRKDIESVDRYFLEVYVALTLKAARSRSELDKITNKIVEFSDIWAMLIDISFGSRVAVESLDEEGITTLRRGRKESVARAAGKLLTSELAGHPLPPFAFSIQPDRATNKLNKTRFAQVYVVRTLSQAGEKLVNFEVTQSRDEAGFKF